jgi:hypothetical protein
MIRLLALLLPVFLIASACTGGDSPSRTATPAPSPEGSTSALPHQSPGAEVFRTGPPITPSESTGSIPAEHDGRTLVAVAGFGEEILLEAERRVPPVPGEPIGQGAASFDQLFLFWNPPTGAFREAWSNQSTRYETVTDIDGDWAVSLLYRLNPGNLWILRLRNLSTGEVRDIDRESEAGRGLESVYPVSIDAGRVAYTRHSGQGSRRTADVILYEIATGESKSLAHREFTVDVGGAAIGPTSLDGDRLAWSEQDGVQAPIQTTVMELKSGSIQTINDDRLGICQLVRGSEWLACTAPVSLLSSNTESHLKTNVYHPASKKLAQLSDHGAPGEHTWNSWMQTAAVAQPWARASLHNLISNETRVLESENAGQSGRLIDGWFTWIEWVNTPAGTRDNAASTLHAIRLP